MSAKVLTAVAVAVVAGALSARPGAGAEKGEYGRIIALNPSIVETVYELGAERRLVGISSYSDYPARAMKEKPTVGGIVNIDIEKVISLKPDLVLSNPSVMAREKLGALGIKIEFVPDDTLADIRKSFTRIGQLTGKAREGAALAGKLTEAVAAATGRSKKRARVKVLAVIGYEPLWVAGGVGFLHELIEAAGGENIAADIKKDFYAIDFERVVARKPDCIIDLTLEKAADEDARRSVLSFWHRFEVIPAVASGRVEFVDSDLLTIPGPRLVKGLDALERALHPPDERVKPSGETPGEALADE